VSAVSTLTAREDVVFNGVWQWVTQLLDAPDRLNVFKSNQNMTATPSGNYAVIQPGVRLRQNQGVRTYDPVGGFQNVERSTTYYYQVDCYGPLAPDWADTFAIAWRSLWGCDNNVAAGIFTPLYADEPVQLNFDNGEQMYEQRFCIKLYAQVNQQVSLPQDFFTQVPPTTLVVADNLPP
jgi:hypothetical protein